MPEARDPEQLLKKAMEGDRPSLVALLEECAPRIRARIEPKIGGSLRALLDVDDVMQVTYLEAVLRIGRFQGGGATGFLAWLGRLAENNLIDAVRSLEAARRPDPRKKVTGMATQSRDSMVALVDLLGVSTTTPSINVARDESAKAIDRALKTLPPDYEKVVRLYDLGGKSMEEVAREMGRTEGAAYMLRARAHDRLREAMGPAGNFFSHAP
ncbi:MAG: sigma-70 family RNA polymerase sigma factor [Phycisphaerae bacterium]|nr:sigma-70 family RNA polymerase sigma factor [Phycisphaerae bacterium]